VVNYWILSCTTSIYKLFVAAIKIDGIENKLEVAEFASASKKVH
jgi:hypothetical protein